jgi:hypothetical protein
LETGVTSLLQRVPIVELTYNGIGESIGTWTWWVLPDVTTLLTKSCTS